MEGPKGSTQVPVLVEGRAQVSHTSSSSSSLVWVDEAIRMFQACEGVRHSTELESQESLDGYLAHLL